MGVNIAKASPKTSKALASRAVMAAMQKQHGDQVATYGNGYISPGRVPTGIFPLDLAIGGGFPFWRISMPFGQESSGKTALVTKLMAMVQRVAKRTAVLIDAEHVYDPEWAARLGLDTTKVVIMQPDTGEQAVEAAEGMVNADDVGIVVLDSIAAIQPTKWIDSDAGSSHVGGNTQLLSDLYTKVGVGLSRQKKRGMPVMFVAVNQITYKIGTGPHQNPETTKGGMIPKFASSLSLRLYSKKVSDKEVSKDMPATLTTTGTVTKWRVPIIGNAFEYTMCMSPHNGYQTGEIMDTWKTVYHRLQSSGDLVNKGTGKGYALLGYDAKTLVEMESFFRSNFDWRMKCEQRVFESAKQVVVPK